MPYLPSLPFLSAGRRSGHQALAVATATAAGTAVLVAGLWGLAPSSKAAGEPPAGPAAVVVPTVAVASRATGGGLDIEGTVEALRQATVAAQIGGNVLSLSVKAGDRVQAGQILARIDERDAAAAFSRSDATVAQAEAEWQNARTALERQRELRRQGFVSQAAVDSADTQAKAAEAGLQAARSGRSQAALARGFAAVVAPFEGVVLATHVDAGDLASPGRPVATLYAPGAMRAVVQVPASRASLARQASQRQVRLPGGEQVAPVRSTELPVTDPVAQTIEWRLDLPARAQVMPGQSVSVRFDGADAAAAAAPAAQASDALRPAVPVDAVLQRGELQAVYLVRGEQFVLRAVRLGARRSDGSVEVLAGLKAGDRIALDAVRAGLAGAHPARP